MKKCFIAALIVYMLLIFFHIQASGQELSSDPEVVGYVDLEKYAGLWYEIARLPNSFQSDCDCNVTATYSLKEDGSISVLNRCLEEDGEYDESEGIAEIVDTKTNSKLEVSFVSIFGVNLFWGDYWIIGLDEDYNWAVVGTASRKYAWILSRTPEIEEAAKEEIFTILRKNGFEKNELIFTEQNRQ